MGRKDRIINSIDDFDFVTLTVHAGEQANPQTDALCQQIDLATAFKLPKFGGKLMEVLMLETSTASHA